jgi:hypothetical protein
MTSASLRDKLSALSLELDRYLARDYGIDPDKAKAFSAWRESHQPFHWFAEFYGVMREGGFDVVIGNPPYVEGAASEGTILKKDPNAKTSFAQPARKKRDWHENLLSQWR